VLMPHGPSFSLDCQLTAGLAKLRKTDLARPLPSVANPPLHHPVRPPNVHVGAIPLHTPHFSLSRIFPPSYYPFWRRSSPDLASRAEDW
jgi:hypothetical protein